MQGLCHEGLATETGLSASFAPRRTRVVCVGGGDEAGTPLQMRPRLTQDKEPSSFAVFFLCSFFPSRVYPLPFPLVPSLLPLALQRRKRERRNRNHMYKTPASACQALSTWLMLREGFLGAKSWAQNFI